MPSILYLAASNFREKANCPILDVTVLTTQQLALLKAEIELVWISLGIGFEQRHREDQKFYERVRAELLVRKEEARKTG